AEVCSNVFGVVSTSFARKVDPNLKSAAEECAATAGEFIAESESFAIRPRRSGNHSFTSTDLGRSCGDAVYEKLESLGRNPSVNLDDPDKEIFVEMRQNAAYVFTGISKGVGGLPVGTQGKMVVLLSGGIDSPVAAWLLMRRGVKVIPVFCNNAPFSDEATRQKAIKCVKVLNEWSAGNPMKMYEGCTGLLLKLWKKKKHQVLLPGHLWVRWLPRQLSTCMLKFMVWDFLYIIRS
ncbi:MAG: thiamine biosynthesis protein ThiI, partial [Methanohalophilus sp.]